MMKWIFSLLILFSMVFGCINGRMDQVSSAALSECGKAVELSFSLMGSICLWSGLMKVAQESGLTEKIAALLSPITTRIFRDVNRGSRAMQMIALNITANLLGLGNAATPLGLAAMQELDRANPHPETASSDMILFVVCNTASIQLIPTTIAVLRLKYGAQSPLDILPAVWISSALALCAGLFLAKFLGWLLPSTDRSPRSQQRKIS